MDNAESATNAASGMSGKMMDGRPLVVRLRSEGPDKKNFDRPRGFGPMENDESKVGTGGHLEEGLMLHDSQDALPACASYCIACVNRRRS